MVCDCVTDPAQKRSDMQALTGAGAGIFLTANTTAILSRIPPAQLGVGHVRQTLFGGDPAMPVVEAG